MNRHLLAIAALAVLCVAGPSGAQFPTVPPVGIAGPGPTVSPYVNLITGGGIPGANYYGLVRPQIQNQFALQQLQTQFGMLAAQANQLGTPAIQGQMLTTGHSATFFNTMQYYPVGGFPPRPARAISGR